MSRSTSSRHRFAITRTKHSTNITTPVHGLIQSKSVPAPNLPPSDARLFQIVDGSRKSHFSNAPVKTPPDVGLFASVGESPRSSREMSLSLPTQFYCGRRAGTPGSCRRALRAPRFLSIFKSIDSGAANSAERTCRIGPTDQASITARKHPIAAL